MKIKRISFNKGKDAVKCYPYELPAKENDYLNVKAVEAAFEEAYGRIDRLNMTRYVSDKAIGKQWKASIQPIAEKKKGRFESGRVTI